MNPGKVVFLSFLTLALAGCAALGYQFLGDSEQVQIVQNTPVMVAGKTATPTVAPTVTPWYDAEATRLAVDADLAAAQKARDELLLIDKKMTQDTSETANKLLLDESERKNKELDAIIKLEQERLDEEKRQQEHDRTVEIKSLEIEQKWQDISMLLVWVGVGLALFFVFALMLKWWRETARSENVTEQEEVTINELQPAPPVPPVFIQDNSDPNYPAIIGMDINEQNKICEFGNRLMFLWDSPISHRNQKLIPTYHLTQVRDILKKYGYASDTKDGLVINGAGQMEIAKLQMLFTDAPIPLHDDKLQDLGKTAGKQDYTTPQDTPQQGGGVVEREKTWPKKSQTKK